MTLTCTFAADVWSIGLIVVECATGAFPFDLSMEKTKVAVQEKVLHTSLPLYHPDLSAESSSFLGACLSHKPKLRPTVKSLLSHSFVRKYEGGGLSPVVAWLKGSKA